MTLKERLNSDLRDAVRARDDLRKSTLRMALAALRNAEIAKREDLDDTGVQRVLSKEVKQRRESIVEFKKAERQDLVEIEQGELDILSSYLPEQLGAAEVEELARKVVQETAASGPGDKGKVMPRLMKELGGRAEGRVASAVVDRLLSSA